MGGAWLLLQKYGAIVYCALFVKEDKTGKRVKWVICTIMHGSYLFYKTIVLYL